MHDKKTIVILARDKGGEVVFNETLPFKDALEFVNLLQAIPVIYADDDEATSYKLTDVFMTFRVSEKAFGIELYLQDLNH